MRYDTPVFFQQITPGAYDASTGNYTEDTVAESMRLASVMDTGTDAMTLIYGKLKENSKTVHVQNHYSKPFDRIRIGDQIYQVDRMRKLRTKQSFIISEVQ